MTKVYFVRHAKPQHDWEDDRTRPLTEEGKKVLLINPDTIDMEFLTQYDSFREFKSNGSFLG